MENPKAPAGQVVIKRVDVITRDMYPAGCFSPAIAKAQLDQLNQNRSGRMGDYYIAFDDKGEQVSGKIEPDIPNLEAQ